MTPTQKAALLGARDVFTGKVTDPTHVSVILNGIVKALEEFEAPELHLVLIAESLQDLPEQIKEQGKAIADLSFSIEEQRYNLQRIENENLQTILSAKQDGKPVYSNDKARQIALEELLQSDTDYQDRKKKLGSDLRNLKEAELRLEYLNNKLKTTLALSRLLEVR